MFVDSSGILPGKTEFISCLEVEEGESREFFLHLLLDNCFRVKVDFYVKDVYIGVT